MPNFSKRTKRFLSLFHEGRSGKEIQRALGYSSMGSVYSVADFLGLSFRDRKTKTREENMKREVPAVEPISVVEVAPVTPVKMSEPVAPPPPPIEEPVTTKRRPSLKEMLEPVMFDRGLFGARYPEMEGCRFIKHDGHDWKYGEPDPNCGKACAEGEDYCPEHRKVVFNGLPTRRAKGESSSFDLYGFSQRRPTPKD